MPTAALTTHTLKSEPSGFRPLRGVAVAQQHGRTEARRRSRAQHRVVDLVTSRCLGPTGAGSLRVGGTEVEVARAQLKVCDELLADLLSISGRSFGLAYYCARKGSICAMNQSRNTSSRRERWRRLG